MNKIKERPIPFQGEMVTAILEGRKTKTRRTKGLNKINVPYGEWEKIPRLQAKTLVR